MKEQKSKIRTGLFSGSFNPVHTGHLIIAHHLLQYTDLQEIWFVITPHNPLKDQSDLLTDEVRLELLHLALEGQQGFRICEREMSLPRPSYTYKTLEILRKEFPERDFVLVIGSDNLKVFDQWKNNEKILSETDIYVYPRKNTMGSDYEKHERVKTIEAPLIEISSTFIREAFRSGKDPRYMLPEKVYRRIKEKRYLD
ncbi:MAG: nicotinate (nicotinamide) nucleotide adenylyltransferase [Bacteroides sp.]|jgi:nicotinate-nucleotide adenylyltransferase|nr:nicotinate (nicotinamide) nucleotide adenylyltransferase [Bacteroides sp.]